MPPLRVRPLPLARAAARALSTHAPFVPPHSLPAAAPAAAAPRPAPASPTFYTARAPFYDALRTLDAARTAAERALRATGVLPLPPAAAAALPPAPTAWKPRAGLAEALGAALTTARHRRVLALLAQLHALRRAALAADAADAAAHLGGILALFERADKAAHLARGARRAVPLDALGRSYTLGRRKESAARVWLVAAPPPPRAGALPTSTLLVNGRALAAYFPHAADRQRAVRPLKLAGLLGAFHVFALVRGGGTTGQAGALAHGIARGLVAHEPDVALILRRAKLLRRDPRMVERKKTGFAKARKRYAWVKR